MPRRPNTITAPPPAPPPEGWAWPFSSKAVREMARWTLREAVDSYESAVERSAAAERAQDAMAPAEDVALREFGYLADGTATAAKETIVACLLLMWGDAKTDLDWERDDFRWQPRGACVDERFVWAEPGTDADGRADYRRCNARLTVADLDSVEDLGSTLTRASRGAD
jgi:hypothetical protein